ncbi:hypothetical protein [Lacticaseibacillus mingshuiensis]|uniref:Uncharacterized protein n=1 Tax=Lacticaseibacillus mingshuiensis TaxID=2799574 RepID=A0ABW4CLB2_9LACO|nr:hypothetical protein [Lacticaseibacillus mingshuiensis]
MGLFLLIAIGGGALTAGAGWLAVRRDSQWFGALTGYLAFCTLINASIAGLDVKMLPGALAISGLAGVLFFAWLGVRVLWQRRK